MVDGDSDGREQWPTVFESITVRMGPILARILRYANFLSILIG